MKRMLCIFILLCLFAGCTDAPGTAWAEQFDQGNTETATIAYIPLDNRPISTQRVTLLAQSAGFCLLMPEEDLYRTSLDGQPLNANGTQYGDRDALLQWIETTAADYYVISIDQLLSGGLVNSRWMQEITDEPQRINRLLTALAGKQVILFDTVMRLAPTVNYGGYTLAEYNALREYGKAPRPLIPGKLTADRVIAGYQIPTSLDDAVVSHYLAARSRKLRLSEYLLSAASCRPEIMLLYGIDDSSPGSTIQTNEIALLKQILPNGHIFAGTDELGLLAVTRAIRSHYSRYSMPKIGIRYFGAAPYAPADDYDIGTLESNVQAHLAALDIESHPTDYDLELLVFGGNDPTALLAHYRNNLQNGMPTMVVDLGEDFCLPTAMTEDTGMDFEYLLSYSSWNTAGNAIGIALSNGIARYLYLKNEPSPVKGASSGFLKGLALSFAKDVCYAQAKPELDRELGADENSFCFAKTDHKKLQQKALMLVQKKGAVSFEHIAAVLEGKHFITALSPQETGTIPRIVITDISFPWYRTFESNIDIQVDPR